MKSTHFAGTSVDLLQNGVYAGDRGQTLFEQRGRASRLTELARNVGGVAIEDW